MIGILVRSRFRVRSGLTAVQSRRGCHCGRHARRQNRTAAAGCGLMIVGESQCQRPTVPRRRGRPVRPARRLPPAALPPGRDRTCCSVARTRCSTAHARSSEVEPLQVSLLRLRVDDVGIVRVDAALEAVAAADVEPVARADAGAVARCATGPSTRCRCPARRRRRCRTAARCRWRSDRTATAAGW